MPESAQQSAQPTDAGFENVHWHLEVLDAVMTEARKLLNEDQLRHVLANFLRMAQQANPLECPGLELTQIVGADPQETFYVSRDRGGVLNPIDLRILFALVPHTRVMVILGMLDIPSERKLPNAVAILTRYRLRRFLET